MALHKSDLPSQIAERLFGGTVIPAHPLALTADREFDPVRQRALTRYYIDAGSGGLAVGVHATQFEIRDVGLFEPVLECAMETAKHWTPIGGERPLIMIAGLAGGTAEAAGEARTAVSIGYHAGLLSLAAMTGSSDDELIAHCETVAAEIPLVGFYLQPAVGGIHLSVDFWRRFAQIENVIAIKAAPFNRYRTLDVIRGVVEAGAEDRIAIYTGNDDHIVLDLLEPFTSLRNGEKVHLRIRGGLLGHWSVWTKSAVEQLSRIHAAVDGGDIGADLLALNSKITDCNRAVFDVENDFAGCIPGCHEILRRQGILEGTWCLNPDEVLSRGQAEELDRVHAGYPEMNDDEFVAENLARWLA